jgi:hypothetical protein
MEPLSILGTSKLGILRQQAQKVRAAGTPGSVAEVGVYRGGSLDLLAEVFHDRRIYGFDTFAGMPPAQHGFELHKQGDFADTSYEGLRDHFAKMRVNVSLVRGLFPGSAAGLEERYCFVHLDGDYYQTTADGISYFFPRLNRGGLIVFDDYTWQHCPGVQKAVDEFVSAQTAGVRGARLGEHQYCMEKIKEG